MFIYKNYSWEAWTWPSKVADEPVVDRGHTMVSWWSKTKHVVNGGPQHGTWCCSLPRRVCWATAACFVCYCGWHKDMESWTLTNNDDLFAAGDDNERTQERIGRGRERLIASCWMFQIAHAVDAWHKDSGVLLDVKESPHTWWRTCLFVRSNTAHLRGTQAQKYQSNHQHHVTPLLHNWIHLVAGWWYG